MLEKKYFPFYWNWADMINQFTDEDNDKETAQLLAWAIVRYASTGVVEDLGNKYLQRMFENCLTVGLDSAQTNYENGSKGGRPSKLTDVDQLMIAQMRAGGQNQTKIAKTFGVSDKTIGRSDGWRNWESYLGEDKNRQNQTKLQDITQNQEEEEEEEEKEEKEEDSNYEPFVPNENGSFDRSTLSDEAKKFGF